MDDAVIVDVQRAVGRAAHLLTPTEPRHAVADTLVSRLDGVAALADGIDAYRRNLRRPRLLNRWPLPDQPDPALRRILEGTPGAMPCRRACSRCGSWCSGGR